MKIMSLKRLISALLAALMVLTLLPTSAWAATTVASGTCGDHLTWTLDSEGTLTISGTGEMENYFGWDNDDAPWYDCRNSIQTVVIQQGVTSIGDRAFYNCTSLTSVSIPSSVTDIGGSAFYECSSLSSISIGDKVTWIGNRAFERTAYSNNADNWADSLLYLGVYLIDAEEDIASALIRSGTKLITADAFDDCDSLTSVTIPGSLTTIEYGPFGGCTSLTSVSIGNGVTSISRYAFYNCENLTSISIPNSVTSIGSSAFSGCSSLSSINIPNSVTSIDDSAFSGCSSLTSVRIGNSVTSIGTYAFGGCTSLTSISIPDSVTDIGYGVFDYCTSLSSIRIGSGVTHMGERAFSGTAYYNDEDNWTNGILYVDACLLEAKSDITTAAIRSGTKLIASEAFAYCDNLTSVSIPNSVTAINDRAFYGCSGLTQVRLPKGIDTVSSGVFCNCSSLEKVSVPEGVKTIEYEAFGVYYSSKGCESLKEVTLPESLTTIKSYAFEGCPNLEDVYYAGSKTQWNKVSIGEKGNSYLTNATIHYNWAPAAPKISSTTVASSGAIKLTWSAVDNAAKYYIYRSTDGGKTYKYYDSTTKTSYTNTSVTPGKTYYYKLKAISTGGATSAYSNAVYRTADCAKPSLSSSIVSSSGAIKLSWDKVTGAAKYYIYRSTDGGKNYSYYTSTTSTSWTNKSVTPGTKYYYKIKAICSNTEGNSAYSNVVYRTADCAKPSLSSSIVSSSGAIKLSWSKVTGAAKYYIYRSTDGGKTYSYYTSTTSTSWTNTSVTPGKTYYYKIKAICSNTEGNSAYSNVVSRTADCAKPVVTIQLNSGKPQLKWSAVTGAKEYVIYRATSKSGTYTKMLTTTKLSYTNTGAKAGTTYYYKVKAVCAKSSYGNSAYSSVVSIKSK